MRAILAPIGGYFYLKPLNYFRSSNLRREKKLEKIRFSSKCSRVGPVFRSCLRVKPSDEHVKHANVHIRKHGKNARSDFSVLDKK